ncbi:glycoside hydrolase family 108 protein [Delftia acidovorans]|uniref:Glycosyl hydrolase 108 family protein n=1 Tax=Delftia acidovorans TaxID=80866 RepID=A0AAJ2R7Q4_DELAC|nr:glycosyl hydrolase 108 family protein [Delftia acidovorans]MDX4957219.1 glycosyl hydrolase 108 family protein [Delftia acidovorans]
MSEFLPAFEAMIVNEGGYKLTNVAGDKGGMTYAGIARNRWPNWSGWDAIDAGGRPAADAVRAFYKQNFWDVMRLDDVSSQVIARHLFDFGVNAGTGTAVKIAQVVAGVTPDGAVGPLTLAALNMSDPELFSARYTIAKVARYRDIVMRDRGQIKFLLGWLNRTLKEAA